jgi:hypothetical protein
MVHCPVAGQPVGYCRGGIGSTLSTYKPDDEEMKMGTDFLSYGPLSLGRCHVGPWAHVAHMSATHDSVPCGRQTLPMKKVFNMIASQPGWISKKGLHVMMEGITST